MKRLSDNTQYVLFVALCTLWTAVCFVFPDFLDNPWTGFRGFCTISAYTAAIGGAVFFLLYAVCINKYVCAVVLPIYAATGAAISYSRVALKATLTPIIIDVTLHTNAEEALGVLSWQMTIWILCNVAVAIGLVVLRWRKAHPTHKTIQAVVAFALLLVYYNANGRLHYSINQRFPFNIYHNLCLYRQLNQEIDKERSPYPTAAVDVPDSLDVVFVLGESLRADHLALNGYERPTTPHLSKARNVVSLPHIYSEHTHTNASVPHILSPANCVNPNNAQEYHSFILSYKQAAFRTAWLSNQDKGHTFASFIAEADTAIFPNASKSVFVFDEWIDKDLLTPLDTLRLHATARNLYILHTIGSHWYYNNHVPSDMQQFQPVTDNRLVTANTQEQVVNSYDNTALYMDWFMQQLITRFEDRKAIIIYLSDHGEALGEDGHYLHASGTEAEKKPACVVWYSNQYAALFPDKITALHSNHDKHYRTDFLFYSILSAAGIYATGGEMLDIFAQSEKGQ